MKQTKSPTYISDQRYHEEQLIKGFVEPSRHERFIEFLASPRKRSKFTQELAHRKTRFLNSKTLMPIPAKQQDPTSIFSLLQQLGAPSKCYVVSEGPLDGQEIGLLDALDEVVGRGMGTILSCVPGRLAYFESEDERYILRR